MNDWAVYRIDYNSNEFIVEKGLTKSQADEIAAEYIRRGHHQHYWVDKQPANIIDHIALLDKILKSGSTRKMAIRVLVSQGTSTSDCVDALLKCTTMDEQECKKLVSSVTDHRGDSGG